jgi:hypothetical protein
MKRGCSLCADKRVESNSCFSLSYGKRFRITYLNIQKRITEIYRKNCGPDSSVGMATGYGLDSLGIESRRGRDFSHLSRPVLGSTQPSVEWVPGLSGGKERPGREADLSHPSSAVVKKE